MNSVFTYVEDQLGLSISLSINSSGFIGVALKKIYAFPPREIGAEGEGGVCKLFNVKGSLPTHELAAVDTALPMVAVGSQPLPDGNTFVRGGILAVPSSGHCFESPSPPTHGPSATPFFTGETFSDVPKDTDYYYGVVVEPSTFSSSSYACYRGVKVANLAGGSNNTLGYYTVRRKGNTLILMRRAELNNIGSETVMHSVVIPEDEVDDALYPLYYQEAAGDYI